MIKLSIFNIAFLLSSLVALYYQMRLLIIVDKWCIKKYGLRRGLLNAYNPLRLRQQMQAYAQIRLEVQGSAPIMNRAKVSLCVWVVLATFCFYCGGFIARVPVK